METSKKTFKYRCECCDFNTDKSSTFNDHNKSKKHLKNKNNNNTENIIMEVSSNKSVVEMEESNENCSMISVASNESYMTIKIRELENTIKMKDMELKMKDEQIELLKNTINILSQNRLKEEPKEEPKKEIKSKIKPKTQRVKFDDLPKNALTIEKFYQEYIKNAEETHYTQIAEVLHLHMTILKPQYFKSGMLNMLKASMTIVQESLKECDKSICPIVCINKQKKRFWVNTEGNGWISSNKNKELVNNALMTLYNRITNYLYNSYFEFKNRLKCIDTSNSDTIDDIKEKRKQKIELTEAEKKSYNEYLSTLDRQNLFKNYTSIDWEVFYDIHENNVTGVMLNGTSKDFHSKSFKYFKASLICSTDVDTLMKQYDTNKSKNNDDDESDDDESESEEEE